MRQLLAKLDNMDQDLPEVLSSEDLIAIRRQLSEGQTSARETVERLRQAQEENDMITRRRDELEARVTALEMEYEELLGGVYSSSISIFLAHIFFFRTEKTIHEEEVNNVDVADLMADLKVNSIAINQGCILILLSRIS